MISVEQQIKLLHQSFLQQFQELKEENKNIEGRLLKIEEILCSSKNIEEKKKDYIEEKFTNVRKPSQEKENTLVQQDEKKKISPNKQKPMAQKTKKEKKIQKTNVTKNTKVAVRDETDDEDIIDDFEDTNFDQNIDNLVDNFDQDEITESSENKIPDDGSRHDVDVKSLPYTTFAGASFRPLTGWRNSDGDYEISEEIVVFSQSMVWTLKHYKMNKIEL